MDLDFLCIGVQKAGTTWLDRVLRSHRDVWLPCVKELHYYDERFVPFTRAWSSQHRLKHSADIIRWQNESRSPDPRILREARFIGRETVDAAWYRELFDMCPAGRIKGEVTPEYCLAGDEGIEVMKADNPRAHYFLMLREPVSRDLSHMRMIIGNEGFPPGSPASVYEHRFATWLQWLAHEKRGEYLPILERWTRLVDPDHLHVLFFEHVKVTPDAVVDRVCRVLGLSRDGIQRDVREVVHQGPKFEIPASVKQVIRDRHREAIAKIRADYGLGDLW